MIPGNLNKMLAKAQKAQEQMQTEIAALRAEGTAGGGVVKATVDGQKNFLALSIAPEVLEDKDPAMLADLVISAFHDATRQIDAETKKKMSSMMGMLGLPPGMGF